MKHCPFVAILLLCSAATIVRSATVFYDPTPYTSAADSPFDLSDLGETFFLEDFEDGEVDEPGLVISVGVTSGILGPSPITDSVDVDDGVFDGYGRDGHSLYSWVRFTLPMDPPVHTYEIRIRFDEMALGFLPTAVGFVWTDGPPASRVTIGVIRPGSQEAVERARFFGVGDGLHNGSAADDRFFGVSSDTPIAGIVIANANVGNLILPFEVDHIQYGVQQIPEPRTTALAVLFLILSASARTFTNAARRQSSASMPNRLEVGLRGLDTVN